MVNFTTDDILLYISNELSPSQTIAFETALLNDWSLQERYAVLSESSKAVQQNLLKPRKKAVDFILAYAEKGIEVKL